MAKPKDPTKKPETEDDDAMQEALVRAAEEAETPGEPLSGSAILPPSDKEVVAEPIEVHDETTSPSMGVAAKPPSSPKATTTTANAATETKTVAVRPAAPPPPPPKAARPTTGGAAPPEKKTLTGLGVPPPPTAATPSARAVGPLPPPTGPRVMPPAAPPTVPAQMVVNIHLNGRGGAKDANAPAAPPTSARSSRPAGDEAPASDTDAITSDPVEREVLRRGRDGDSEPTESLPPTRIEPRPPRRIAIDEPAPASPPPSSGTEVIETTIRRPAVPPPPIDPPAPTVPASDPEPRRVPEARVVEEDRVTVQRVPTDSTPPPVTREQVTERPNWLNRVLLAAATLALLVGALLAIPWIVKGWREMMAAIPPVPAATAVPVIPTAAPVVVAPLPDAGPPPIDCAGVALGRGMRIYVDDAGAEWPVYDRRACLDTSLQAPSLQTVH